MKNRSTVGGAPFFMPKQPVGRKCMTILMSNPITNKNFLFEEFSNSTVSDGILFDKEVQELTFLKKQNRGSEGWPNLCAKLGDKRKYVSQMSHFCEKWF